MGRNSWRTLGLALAALLWALPVLAQTTTQAVEYYHTDALGSVRAVTKAGVVVSRHDFMPFGEEVSPQNPPADKRLFTGAERDFETGFDHLWMRQLRFDQGRFVSVDPTSLAGTMRLTDPRRLSPYLYVHNNPVGLFDPTGLQELSPYVLGLPPDSPDPDFNPDFNTGFGPGFGPLFGNLFPAGDMEARCFAQLKGREVRDVPVQTRFIHTFWYVQARNGTQYILNGYPGGVTKIPRWPGWLDMYTKTNINGLPDTPAEHTYWDSGMGPWCAQVDRMLAAVNKWVNGLVPYYWPGPNSNSAAFYLGCSPI